MPQTYLQEVHEFLQNAVRVDPPDEVSLKKVNLPKSRHNFTIFFDLDETLVHTGDDLSQFKSRVTIP